MPAREGRSPARRPSSDARYSAFFLRRSTISPSNRTASTAQTMRTREASIVLSPFAQNQKSSHVVHHGDQLPHDAHDHRAYCYNEQSWQNTEKDREYELDAQLGGLFFGHLTALHAHIVSVAAQAGRNSGAEPVSLNKHSDKFLDVFRTAPVGEVAQRLGAALAGFQL